MLPASQSIGSTAVLATSLTSPLPTFPKLASGARNSIHTATSLPLSMYSEHLSPDVPSLPQHSFNMAKKPSSLFSLEDIAFACCPADKTSQGEGTLFTAATLELRAMSAPNKHLVEGMSDHTVPSWSSQKLLCHCLHFPPPS